MARIILGLAVIASFNIIAIQLFMAGHIGPLADVLPYQQALLVSASGIIVMDFVLLYMLLTFGPRRGARSGFDALFKKYYDGTNFDEAFSRATAEWRKRNG